MTPTTYGRDFAYCLKSHGGVRGFNASLWRFLLRCTLFCHSVATFLTSVSSYEGGCGFEVNLSTSAYCKIEYGETDLTLTRLDKIAKVLGISALSLFSHIDKSMNPDTDNSCKNNSNNDSAYDLNDLRELIKANTRIIDLLSKRIDLLEQRL